MSDWTLVRKGRKRATRESEDTRFWVKVAKNPEGCWLWTAGLDDAGYGAFMMRKNDKWRMTRAHIWSYERANGILPEGMTLDHRVCRNKLCVRPDHLVPCTRSEHAYQPDSGAGMRLAKTACKRGHPFDAANTYIRPNGMRMCRECAREAKRDAYQSMDFEERTDRQRAYRYSR